MMNKAVHRRLLLLFPSLSCIYFLYAYTSIVDHRSSFMAFTVKINETKSMISETDPPELRLDNQSLLNPFSEEVTDTEYPNLKLNPITKAYELDGKPIIWQYWRSKKMPLYVQLLTEALQCRNPEFKVIVVHEEDVYQYLPDLQVDKDVFKLLHAPHQADIFRLAILLRYGGVYTDVDVYALDKIYPLYELLADYDLIIGDWGKYDLAFGGMGPTRANVSLFQVWHDQQISKLRSVFPRGNEKNLTEDPLSWTSILYGVEKGIGKEIESNRTTWIRYNGPITNHQLIRKGYQHSAHARWSEAGPRVLPLNWSPFLFVWGAKMRELFSNMTKIDQLLPENSTLYSAFVGCALLDCHEEYMNLKKAGKEAAAYHFNVTEMLEALQNVNRSICDSIRKKPIFELDKYKL